MNNVLQSTIDVYNTSAAEFILNTQNAAPERERLVFMSYIASKDGDQKKILDVGCGSGRDTNYFAQCGYQAVGIDMSVELLKHANKTRVGTAHFYKMDMRQITLQTDSFDGIWACASLLHLTHKEVPAVLSRLYALLKSDGTMFVSVKVGEGEGMAASDSIPGQKRFFSYYSTDELENLLRSAGFLITDIYTWDQHDRNSERSPQVWISCFVRKQ